MNKSITRILGRATILSGLLALATLAACGSKNSTFSILQDQNSFKQSATVVNGKIDILWVVDNSGSMESSQQAVATNFGSFIQKFNEKGYDYRMAVTTTDAYKVLFGADPSKAKFRDGTDWTSHTGIFVIEPTSPNLVDTFMTNIQQGIYGAGDERAFQSMREALISPLNSGFPRPDAFLAVIIVSDEEDFSHDGSSTCDGVCADADLHSVQSYVDFLDQLTGVTGADSAALAKSRRTKYNVNSIAILDEACKTSLNTTFTGRKIANRYIALSDATNGAKASLCSDFGQSLAEISNKIILMNNEFQLDGDPNPDTIVVTVNGANVPRLAEDAPAPLNGFVYHPSTNTITLHGSYEPAAGASISVKFDPMSLR